MSEDREVKYESSQMYLGSPFTIIDGVRRVLSQDGIWSSPGIYDVLADVLGE